DNSSQHVSLNVNRYRIVTQIRDYIIANRNQVITVPDLCRNFYISRRMLQYCFQEVVGMTPVAYLRALRLNGARRDLRDVASEYATVQDIAATWGFWHLSQFARDYQRLFGELPSASLRARVH
ncbi:MAG: helix-turn-helix domain-containing protein, partial [Acidobacteriaceae bacterium]